MLRPATLLVLLAASPAALQAQTTVAADPPAIAPVDARRQAVRAAAIGPVAPDSPPPGSAEAQLRSNLNRYIEGRGGNEQLRERARQQADRTRDALALQAAALRGDANAGRQLERVVIEGQSEPAESLQARFARRMPAPDLKQGYRRTEDPVTGEVCETVDVGLWSPLTKTVCAGAKQGPGTAPGSIISELNRK
ncbi:MAG TPA: hypothetical protein VFK82_06855 [Burkholderiaceae bacterium]|nr:hypothetical protein [Burkholderiaceae bacterium]